MTTDTLELPELPKNEWQVIGHPVYTADQLRAYATAAVLAERARQSKRAAGVPTCSDLRIAADRAECVLGQVAVDMEATGQLLEWHNSVTDVRNQLRAAIGGPVVEEIAAETIRGLG